MTCFHTGLYTLLALLVAGASAKAVEKDNKIPDDLRIMLEKAEQFELLSLSPLWPREEPKNSFHGWEVLGRTNVKGAETRRKLIAAFKKGVEEGKEIEAVPGCFNPRLGLRVSYEGKTADFAICFECLQVYVFVGDQEKGFLITSSPESAFDEVLKQAKVPLAEKPKR